MKQRRLIRAGAALTGVLVVAGAVGSAFPLPAQATTPLNPLGDPGYFTFAASSPYPGVSMRVNVGNGNLVVESQDLQSAPATDYVPLTRFYNSGSTADQDLGPGWSFDVGPGTNVQNSGSTVSLSGPSGYDVQLTPGGDGSFTPPPGFSGALTQNENGTYSLMDVADGGITSDTYAFSSSGVLTGLTDTLGNSFSVAYTSAAGRTVLQSIGSSSGQRVNISYDGDAHAIEADDPASGHRYYGYTQGLLTSYTDPSGSQTTYSYSSSGRLASIAFPDGSLASVAYDSQGRVTSLSDTSSALGGTQTISLTYAENQTTVTDSSGNTTTYTVGDNGVVQAYEGLNDDFALSDSGAIRSASGGDYTPDTLDDSVNVALSANADATSAPEIASVTLMVDGWAVDQDDPSCDDSGCPLPYTDSLGFDSGSLVPGPHFFEVVATADNGEVASEGWTVNVQPFSGDYSESFPGTPGDEMAGTAAGNAITSSQESSGVMEYSNSSQQEGGIKPDLQSAPIGSCALVPGQVQDNGTGRRRNTRALYFQAGVDCRPEENGVSGIATLRNTSNLQNVVWSGNRLEGGIVQLALSRGNYPQAYTGTYRIFGDFYIDAAPGSHWGLGQTFAPVASEIAQTKISCATTDPAQYVLHCYTLSPPYNSPSP